MSLALERGMEWPERQTWKQFVHGDLASFKNIRSPVMCARGSGLNFKKALQLRGAHRCPGEWDLRWSEPKDPPWNQNTAKHSGNDFELMDSLENREGSN